MLVRILGNYGAFDFDKPNTSFLVYLNNGKVWLVDCGYNVPAALKQAGELDNLDGVLITHKHFDHVGGLESLLYYYEFVLERPIRVMDVPLFDDLYLSQVLNLRKVVDGVFFSEPAYVQFEPLYYGFFGSVLPKFDLYSDTILHAFAHSFHVCCPGWLYAIREPDSMVCIFTGDVTMSPYIKELAENFLEDDLDVIVFHDFSLKPSPVHASFEIFAQFEGLMDNERFALIPVHWGGDVLVGTHIATISDARKLMHQVLTKIKKKLKEGVYD